MLEVGKVYKTLQFVGVYPSHIFNNIEKYRDENFSDEYTGLIENKQFIVLEMGIFDGFKTKKYTMYHIWTEDQQYYTMFRLYGDEDLYQFEEIC